MPSLTRIEAISRADLLDVTAYDIDLDLTGDDRYFRSRTTVEFRCADPGASTFLDVQPHSLTSAMLNGRALDAATLTDGRLPLTGLAAENELVVIATMAYSHDGEGLHRHVDPADGNVYLYATSALAAAPRWFACFDQPDLKATITLSMRCPSQWTVVANGAATQVAPGQWHCARTPRMSTYIATVVAGAYHSVTGSHDGIPLSLHVRASLAAQLDRDADELLTLTGDCLDEFHRLFGIRYPWGEYHQAFVPEFNWGAMENPGCVTFRDDMIFRSRSTEAERATRASVVAHEMAHMWFGNLVTMQWWDDLWLNESFAEFLGHRVCDQVTDHASWIDFGIARKSWGYTADRRPSTHPIAGNGASDVDGAQNDFDGISYAKGASVVRQLAAHLGERVFLDGLRSHIQSHAFGNATFADLINAWTAAGAVGLTEWAQQWLRTSGLDTLSLERTGELTALVRQTPAEPASRPHTVTVTSYGADGSELSRTPVSIAANRTVVDGISPAAALALPDAEDQSWAKIALTEAEWAALPSLIGALPAPARVVVCNALRLAVADAELAPLVAVDSVVALLRTEPDEAVLASMSRWAIDSLAGAYLPAGSGRDSTLGAITEAAQELIQAAISGSGRQLTAARMYLAASTQVQTLRGWLSGATPDGIELDADLRWAVLRRLTALGHVDRAELDAELARDNSAQGVVHAARCRSLLPNEQAKAEAWRILTSDAERSNYELFATAEGFWHPAQGELTAPYVARYFAEISATAALRSGLIVGRIALLAYPWTAVAQTTVDATSRLLATDGLEPQVRRAVTDAGDDLRRAAASRARFTALAP